MSRFRQPGFFSRSAPPVFVGVVALLIGLYAGNRLHENAIPVTPAASVQPYFSPDGGCTDAIQAQLMAAKHQIHMEAYAFTSMPIVQALVQAKNRGVDIVAVLDKSNLEAHVASNGELEGRPDLTLTMLAKAGIPVYLDARHRIAHNKVLLIDNSVLITGSFNFTYSAEHYNAENILVITGMPQLIAQYEANFQLNRSQSVPYHPGMTPDELRGWKPAP